MFDKPLMTTSWHEELERKMAKPDLVDISGGPRVFEPGPAGIDRSEAGVVAVL